MNPQYMNPQMMNPQNMNPQLMNPQMMNPQIMNPQYMNPQMMNPQMMNPQYMNPQNMSPHYLQIWNTFQQLNAHYQIQMQQIEIQRQYSDYQSYCQNNKLNPYLENSFQIFYQNYYIKGIKEILPRGDIEIYAEPIEKNAPNLMNIKIKSSSGFIVNLTIPGNISLHEMFKRYMDRLKLPYSYLGNDLKFLFDGKLIDPFSNEPVSYRLRNNVFIIVFDQGGIIGAKD